MRIRIFNKMTENEVQDYLDRGGDTIFVAVGVTECHGAMPIDCETIGPEATAVLLAEKADGLAMINMPYFYPGGTVIGNSTVHVSIRDGIDYLFKICYSLVDQGFKRIFLVSGHGPAGLTIDAFCRDFFEETLIHPCHIAWLTEIKFPKPGEKPDLEAFKAMTYRTYGAYKIMGQMEYLPIDPDAEASEGASIPSEPVLENFMGLMNSFGGRASQIYSRPENHGGGIILKSEEERLEICTKGEEILRKEVENCKIIELKETLAAYHEYVQGVYKKHPRIKKVH